MASKEGLSDKKRQAITSFYSHLYTLKVKNPRKSISKSQNQVHKHTIPIDINQLGSYFGSLHKGPIKPFIVDAIPGYEEDDDLNKQITENNLGIY